MASSGKALPVACTVSAGEGRPTRPQHPTACRSLARRFAPRFSAARCVALWGRQGTRSGERQNVGRLASECSETEISAVGTSARSSSLPRLVKQQRTFCAAAHAVECTFAREPPGAFSVPFKASRESAASGSTPGTHGSGSARSGTLRFCRLTRAAQPRATQPAAGTALLPKRSAAQSQD